MPRKSPVWAMGLAILVSSSDWLLVPGPVRPDVLAGSNLPLRFAGIGNALEVSFNGGVSWTPAQLQALKESIEEHFKSYWMPIPAQVPSNAPGSRALSCSP